jgi:signal transduction histidine kinase
MPKQAASLRTLVIALVLGGAVLPLGVVGFWLAQSAVRSGKTLLTSELTAMLNRLSISTEQRWGARRGNILLLAHNAEVANALTHTTSPARDDSVASYLADLYSQMRSELAVVVIRDAQGTVRWTFEDSVPAARRADTDTAAALAADAPFIVRESIVEDGKRVGELEAHVRFANVVPIDSAARQVAGATVSIFARDGTVLYAPAAMDRAANAQVLSLHRDLNQPSVTISVSAPYEDYVRPFRSASRTGTIALLVVACISLLLTTVLSRRLARPLSALAGAADSVAHGSLEQRVALDGPDEVRRVAAAFNGMTENLRVTLDTLARQRSLAAVGEFAASLAHEVRNALTAVRVDVQRARKKSRDTEVVDLLERTLGHVQHLDRVVTGALHVARSGRARSTVLDISGVLDNAERSVATELASAQVTLTRAQANGALYVSGDAAALQQLFTNLLLNAAEASQPGAVIDVSTRSAGADVIVEIKDEGSGIAADALEQIWEPLFTTKPNGTGLGLPIARQIALAHDGDLVVASREGGGTTVQLRLPIRSGGPDDSTGS